MEDTDVVEMITSKGHRAVHYSRILMVMLLVGLAFGAAFAVFDYTNNQEAQEFENKVRNRWNDAI